MTQQQLQLRKTIIDNLRAIAYPDAPQFLPVVVNQESALELLAMLEEARTVAETFETMFENEYYVVIDESIGKSFLQETGEYLDHLYEVLGDKP